MSSLADKKPKLSYRTGRDDLVRDFFLPCMESSVLYRRAAGYFTSAGLALAARGVASLASRRGKMMLVVSPYLEPADVEALLGAYSNPAEALRAITARNLADIEDALVRDRLNALAWLSAAGLLEIKLALRLDAQGGFARGIFHEKTGIFTDKDGNHVAFSGSSNETAGGLVQNFESIKVFCSWSDQEGRVQEEIENFENLWSDATPGLRVIAFPAARDLLERFRDPERPPAGLSLDRVRVPALDTAFSPPGGLELRPYQLDAIRAWSKAGGRGIFAMATGSGKTLTALYLAYKVAEKNKPLVLIVICPFINLCRQWLREMVAFGLKPTACYEGKDRWQTELEEGYQRLSVGMSQVHAIIVTNATFQSDAFQARLRPRVASSSGHHLLIADEVHNLGAERIRDALPQGITMRLGLEQGKRHVITTAIEHKAVLEPCDVLEREGFEVTRLPVGESGAIEPEAVRGTLRPDTLLVSVMQVNNETGVCQPIDAIAGILQGHEAYFHTDAAQGFGKELATLKHPRIDLISISGHKIYAPKGIGALVMRRRGYARAPLTPLAFGGGQERGLRPGTLPVPLIAALGAAAEIAVRDHARRQEACAMFRKKAVQLLSPLCPKFTGDPSKAMDHVLNLSFPGLDSEALMVALKDLIAISNGSACTSSSYTPSHVLKAMGMSDEEANACVRLSWCHLTPEVDWEYVAHRIRTLQ